MQRYTKKFLTILEADAKNEDAPEELSDSEAFSMKLDSGTDASTFDTPAMVPHKNVVRSQHCEQLQNWVQEIQSMVQKLNGTEGDSIQAILSKADCETLMHDVARSEGKKISRIAQELSSLVESLKAYTLRSKEG